MLLIIGTMLAGVLLGYVLRFKRFDFVQHVITGLIWILLFLLGLEVGANEEIVHALPLLGGETLLITSGALLGSVIAASILGCMLNLNKKRESKTESCNSEGADGNRDSETLATESSPLKGSLIIILFFLLGMVLGYFRWMPAFLLSDKLSLYALCVLMFSVGFGIGNDPQTIRNFRTLNPRLIFLPLMTIVGTLGGCALLSIVLHHRSPFECMAVGSGFGYYSLSSIFITQYKGAELGTIALLSNITREIITLLCAPLLVRWFGRLAPISAGGATTMDTTLPIITRCSGKEFAVVSVFHGFVMDLSVPFLVTFFCSF